jgi:Phage integrase SAM-like domain
MNVLTQTIGTQSDTDLHDSSQAVHISTEKLATVQELLARLQNDKQIAMLRTTAGHVANFLNVAVEKIAIDALVGIVPEFRAYLKQRHYKRNAANSYCNYAGMLIRKAKELGWLPTNPEIPREWAAVFSAMKPLRGVGGIINFAIARGKTPATLSDGDLDNWARMTLAQGKCYDYATGCRKFFAACFSGQGCLKRFPGFFVIGNRLHNILYRS